jgi:DNA-binding transcriptional ArsR family regulator
VAPYAKDDIWNVLGDPTRRAIVEHLAEQPLAVVEIAARLPVSRPAVSQHLKVLKDTGLVSEEAVGRRHIYRLNAAAVSALRDQLDTFWNRALAGYQAALEQPTKDQQ